MSEATQPQAVPSSCGDDEEGLEKGLLRLHLSERWERVGASRLANPTIDPRRPNRFCGMEHIQFHNTGYTGNEQNQDTLASKKKPRGFVKVEAGSSLRLIRRSTTRTLPSAEEIMTRPNFPEIIGRGIEAYKGGERFPIGHTMLRFGEVVMEPSDDSAGRDLVADPSRISVQSIRRSRSTRSQPVDILCASPWGSHLSASLGSAPSTAISGPLPVPKSEARLRLALLGDLHRWMLKRKITADELWLMVTPTLTCREDAFVSQIMAQGFTSDEDAARRLFKHMDSESLGEITREDIQMALESFVIGPTRSPSVPEAAKVDVDAFKNAVPEGAQSNLVHAFPMRLKAVGQEDPVVGQLMAFMTSSFHTIGEAFDLIDLNRNKALSKTEFVDGLRELRCPKGRNPLVEHLKDIFRRLDAEHIGTMVPEDIVYILQSSHQRRRAVGDPLLERLALYLLAYAPDKMPPGHNSDKEKLEQLLGSQGKPALGALDFIKELMRLRYDHWHLGDLFCRLDKEHRGLLTKETFSAFLEPEARQEVHLSSGSSRLLGARTSSYASSEVTAGNMANRDSIMLPANEAHLAAQRRRQLSFVQTRPDYAPYLLLEPHERPDHLGHIREHVSESSASRGLSQLILCGKHQLLSNTESAPDLTKPAGALQHFNTREPRTRYNVV